MKNRITFEIIGTGLFLAVASFGAGFLIADQRQAPQVQGREIVRPLESSFTGQKPQVEYINRLRAENGLPALREDSGLNKTANLKAQDTIDRQYWSHNEPDGKPFYRMVYQERPGLTRTGENLTKCMDTIESAVQHWRESPSHLQAILDPNYTLYGSAMVWSEKETCFIYVNHFGAE